MYVGAACAATSVPVKGLGGASRSMDCRGFQQLLELLEGTGIVQRERPVVQGPRLHGKEPRKSFVARANLVVPPTADPHGGWYGGWGPETSGNRLAVIVSPGGLIALLALGLPGIFEGWAVDHACYLRLGRGGLALTARPGRGVHDGAGEVAAPQAMLRVSDCLTLGVCRRVTARDDATWTIANDCAVGYEHSSVWLIAPGFGKLFH